MREILTYGSVRGSSHSGEESTLFCPPSLSAAAEFRISLCEMRRHKLVKIKEKMYSNNRFEIQVFIILFYHTIIIIQVWHKRIKSARI